MMSRKVYQDLLNKELRLSQNFEKLHTGTALPQSKTLMQHSLNITDVEGILVGHYTMRKLPMGCTVLAWILAIVAHVFGQTREPFIYFEQTSADFGAVRQGDTLKQVFRFTNRGSGTLEILRVTPS
jgi:hypothetical protein